MRRFLFGLCLCWLLPLANAATTPIVLVFGDSLSAGYGMSAQAAWPSLLQQDLTRRKLNWQVMNASVSGETSAGGLTRLPATLARHKPKLVILELGANDGLRGLPLPALEKNLAQMIQLAQASGAKVHLIGIRIPPNYGPDYTEKFTAIYPALAKKYGASLTPFLLAPVIEQRDLFQADGLHPTAAAQPRLLKMLLEDLKTLR